MSLVWQEISLLSVQQPALGGVFLKEQITGVEIVNTHINTIKVLVN